MPSLFCILIPHFKFQFSKSIKSSTFHIFLNLTYSLRKNIFPKMTKNHPKIITRPPNSGYGCKHRVACRTGGLGGPARYTSAPEAWEQARSVKPEIFACRPLFMLFQLFAWRTVCADWLLYITWSSNVFLRRNTITYSDLNQQQIDWR